MRKFLFIILLLTFTVTGASAATFDPSFKFVTLETDHFTIYFHQGLEETGQRAAVIAEEVHQKLTKLFKWSPREKTNIVIADNSDFANGMTTVIPYNAMYLQTALPAAASSIGSYDDWLRLLITHEYAHVLTSDPVRGYSETMRRIFGKVYPVDEPLGFLFFLIAGPPNTMMPHWWHEGMATWAETELTASGRGRNSYYQMIYRTAVAENNLPTIDRINGEMPNWPAGNAPYVYGSSLIQYIADKYGKEKPADLSIQQSGRFPYFINTPPEQQLGGRNYQRLYSEMLLNLRQEQRKSIDSLSREPFTSLIMVGKKGGIEQVPRFSRDGSMVAFNRDDRHSHPSIVVLDKSGKEIAKIRRNYGEGGLGWSPDNKMIFFSQAEVSLAGNDYQDIYSYSLKEKKTKRLTEGQRASDPDLSPDGRKLLFVAKKTNAQELALYDLTTLESTPKSEPETIRHYSDTRLNSPRWAPDNNNILFVKTDRNGHSTLQIVNTSDKSQREILSTNGSILSACWSPDGKTIFYIADTNGVFNLHSLDLSTGNTTQITHVLSGIMSADVSAADGTIAVEHYSSEGFTTAFITRGALRNLQTAAPSVAQSSYKVNSAMLPSPGLQAQAPLGTSPYSPVATLLPKFWLPSIIPETGSDSAFGVMTAGQDVLGRHSYLAKLLYGAVYDRAYFDTMYQYGRHIPTLSLHAYSLPLTYSKLLSTGDYTENETGLLAQLSSPLFSQDSGYLVSAGYHLRDERALSSGPLSSFNGARVFEGRRDSLFAGIDFYNRYRYPWSITSEEGRSAGFKIEYFGRPTGSSIETRKYTASWQELIPLGGHHNLMAQIQGGFADGEQTPQGFFQIGGLPSFLNQYGIRGYDSMFTNGSRVATGTLEYRFPLSYLLSGSGTAPLFYEKLHGALFTDAGETWSSSRSFKAADIMVGAGVEVRMDVSLGYWLRITPALGYAHGFNSKFGSDQIYFTVYANL